MICALFFLRTHLIISYQFIHFIHICCCCCCCCILFCTGISFIYGLSLFAFAVPFAHSIAIFAFMLFFVDGAARVCVKFSIFFLLLVDSLLSTSFLCHTINSDLNWNKKRYMISDHYNKWILQFNEENYFRI